MTEAIHRDDVISLACVRFEETLADGPTRAFSHPHLAECASCEALAREMMGVDGLFDTIAQVSGPVELPDGFVDAVMLRAALPEPAAPPAPVEAKLSWQHYGLSGLMAGMVAALVTWIVQPPAPQPAPATRPEAVMVERNPEATPKTLLRAPAPRPPVATPTAPAGKMNPTAPAPKPHVVPPKTVPEPAVKLPQEIKTAILRHIRSLPFCPRRITGSVRVTLTVEPTGKVTNRQVLSRSGQASAHQCVNLGIDKLILPPMKAGTVITVDLKW